MRVAVTTSYGYWGSFTPDELFAPGGTHMIGGGETALLWLARGLAAAGHRVDVFYDTARPGTYYGIDFLPKALKADMICLKDYDLLIAWEDVEAISFAHRAKTVIYAVQCNDLKIGVRDWGIDAYQTVSSWHIDTLLGTDENVTPEKFFVFPNGVDVARYKGPAPERDPYRVIHSSSPDRGLHHLLRIWPRIKRRVPDANLHVYYDMEGWMRIVDNIRAQGGWVNTGDRADQVREGIAKTKGMDVLFHGGVNQWELAKAQQSSAFMVYPCDPSQKTEGFSNSVLEALAAGTPVITTDADAFPELWEEHTLQIPLPFDDDIWTEILVEKLKEGITSPWWKAQSAHGKEVAKRYEWQKLGKQYAHLVEGLVKEKLLGEEEDSSLVP